MRISTKLVHNSATLDGETGAASPPVYRASTFHQNPSASEVQPFVYSRVGNPTRAVLESTMAELEGGSAAFAFASGVAAIAAVFDLIDTGAHLIVPRDLYGGTHQLLTKLAARGRLSMSYVDMTSEEEIRAHITANTRAIYVETPSNPTLRITDLRQVARIGRDRGLLTIADNTFMSPYLQRPLALGFDIVIHSATKFLGGHSDVLAGVVVAASQWVSQALGEIQKVTGGVLGPDDSWLVVRGIKTLGVRLEREQSNAMLLAKMLRDREEITQVYYPGLPDHPGHALHKTQADGPGAVLSLVLAPNLSVAAFVKSLRYALFAVSLGGVETIVSHPATMSHAGLDEETRKVMGVTPNLLRVSVGIEALDDLVDDFQQALSEASVLSGYSGQP